MKQSTEARVAHDNAALEEKSVRAALLTPYDGGNLGDAAIQEAVIQNLRRIEPQIELCGITLNPEKTSAAHHIPCFPLAATSLPFYQSSTKPANATGEDAQLLPWTRSPVSSRLFTRLRGIGFIRKPARALLRLAREFRHMAQSYALLRDVDVLIIAGGGQLDEEWGGSWGHPFALMKWNVLARLAGKPVVFLSVGGCVTESRLTRLFLSVALSMACYRSYRDNGSREIALGINSHAKGAVIPDLAFSLPLAGAPREIRPHNQGVRVGVSPIAYSHPRLWPTPDAEKYNRYLVELGAFVAALLKGGISVVLFSSSTPDEQIFQELLTDLHAGLREEELRRLSIGKVESLADLLTLLPSCDFIVASRLHGLLLSFLLGKPSLAISYDRKVGCLMDEQGQAAYSIDIQSISSSDLLAIFSNMQLNARIIPAKLSTVCSHYKQLLEDQYQAVTQIMSAGLHKKGRVRPLSAKDGLRYEDGSEVRRVS